MNFLKNLYRLLKVLIGAVIVAVAIIIQAMVEKLKRVVPV